MVWRSAFAGIAAFTLSALAAGQQEQYRERQVLDPAAPEWVDEIAPRAGTPEGELEEARLLLASGKAHDARKILERWIKANPDHARHYEAVYLLAETHFQTDSFYRAYKLYEQVVENSSGDLYQAALQREMDVSRAFLAGKKRLLWGIFLVPAYDEGVDILDRIHERVPGTRRGEEAVRLRADYHFARGDMELAQDDYVRLGTEYPNGKWVRFATLRAAESANAAFPGVKFDDHALVEAQERYHQVIEKYPEYAQRENVDEIMKGILEKRAAHDLEIGKWYEKTRRGGAATYYYRLVLKDWPDTIAAAEAQKRLRGLGAPVESEEPTKPREEGQ